MFHHFKKCDLWSWFFDRVFVIFIMEFILVIVVKYNFDL